MIFSFCPQCKSTDLEYDKVKAYHCRKCNFTYYHNPAAAAAGIIFYQDQLLLIKRAQDPGKGKPDLPGGFVDPGESVEETIKREIMEELGVRVTSLTYFASFPNTYRYKGILYNTCDLIFEVSINTFPKEWDKDEVADILLVSPGSVHNIDFAFESSKNAVLAYFKRK